MPDGGALTGEIKASLEALTKQVHDEREAAKERDAEIKKFGDALPETQEKIAKIEKAIDSTRDEIDAALAKVQKQGLAGDSKEGKDLTANARAFYCMAQDLSADEAEALEPDLDAYKAYRKGYRAYLRRGGDGYAAGLPHDVRAELSVGQDADGGFWAPTEMSNDVKTRMFETSDVRSVANVISISGGAIEFPTDTNESTSGGWVAEKDARPETNTPKVGKQKIEAHEQYAEPHATQILLDDAAINVEAWLAGKTADILVRTENAAFVNGDGSNKPRGFMNYSAAATAEADTARAWGVLQFIPTGASGGFPTITAMSGASNPDAMLDVIAALKPVYRANARWAMSRATEAVYRKLKDGDGRYFVDMGNIQAGATGFTMFGYPISTMEDMPAVGANSFSTAFGDFRAGYTVLDRIGIRVLRDPYTTKGFVKFYTTKRVGGDVVDFDALKLVKFGVS